MGIAGIARVARVIAFDTVLANKPDIEAFANSILTGVVNTLSFRRKQLVAQQDETFLAMQPHEPKTSLHHL